MNRKLLKESFKDTLKVFSALILMVGVGVAIAYLGSYGFERSPIITIIVSVIAVFVFGWVTSYNMFKEETRR
jgi:4-amino-4-deoxy-L-arabinose transferase-like glycosyltransferase